MSVTGIWKEKTQSLQQFKKQSKSNMKNKLIVEINDTKGACKLVEAIINNAVNVRPNTHKRKSVLKHFAKSRLVHHYSDVFRLDHNRVSKAILRNSNQPLI